MISSRIEGVWIQSVARQIVFAHIRVSEYFTFAKQIIHSVAISLARKGKFRWKKVHIVLVDKCVLFVAKKRANGS